MMSHKQAVGYSEQGEVVERNKNNSITYRVVNMLDVLCTYQCCFTDF